jgi:hypothetical protein
MSLSANSTEFPFRQSVAKIPSERTAQVSSVNVKICLSVYANDDLLLYIVVLSWKMLDSITSQFYPPYVYISDVIISTLSISIMI